MRHIKSICVEKCFLINSLQQTTIYNFSRRIGLKNVSPVAETSAELQNSHFCYFCESSISDSSGKFPSTLKRLWDRVEMVYLRGLLATFEHGWDTLLVRTRLFPSEVEDEEPDERSSLFGKRAGLLLLLLLVGALGPNAGFCLEPPGFESFLGTFPDFGWWLLADAGGFVLLSRRNWCEGLRTGFDVSGEDVEGPLLIVGWLCCRTGPCLDVRSFSSLVSCWIRRSSSRSLFSSFLWSSAVTFFTEWNQNNMLLVLACVFKCST